MALQTAETALRQELKQWEKAFASSNGGKHPTREDIKKDSAIASRYKEYSRRREASSAKTLLPASPCGKRKLADITNHQQRAAHVTSTPRKRVYQQFQQSHTTGDDKENETEAVPLFVGPTPQKDGRVLGLFDLISDAPGTPSKDGNAPPLLLSNIEGSTVQATPSKEKDATQLLAIPPIVRVATTPTTANKHSRTPQSFGKRYLLDSFLTPSKRRRLDEQGTPTSVAKHPQTSTPAFLSRCRSVLTSIAGDGDNTTQEDACNDLVARRIRPGPGPKRRGFTRSLSSMIADLRQNEEDRLDEDMNLLRELEGEGGATSKTSAKTRPKAAPPAVLVEDSQALGPDGSRDLSEDDEGGMAGLGRDGQPLRVWKKKGQKRTTRRVHMRPQPRRRESAPSKEVQDELAAPETANSHTVAETQQIAPAAHDADSDLYSNSSDAAPDADCNAGDSEDERPPASKKQKATTLDKAKASANTAKSTTASGEGIVKKTVKNISATANANFCRLKIRSSKGAKAASGGGGRFGRGRFGKGKR